jgi:hypothetical protein
MSGKRVACTELGCDTYVVTLPKPLTEKDLEEARRRAIAAGALPENVRKELVALWKRQDALPKDLRELSTLNLQPSGWVLTHVLPKVCLHLSAELRRSETHAGAKCAFRLELVAEYVLEDVSKAVSLLTEPTPTGTGSRQASQANATVLRVLDFGLLGLHHVAAVLAKSTGLLDTSITLLSDGHLSINQAVQAANRLDDQVGGKLTKSDKSKEVIELPLELFAPDDFNASRVKGISSTD